MSPGAGGNGCLQLQLAQAQLLLEGGDLVRPRLEPRVTLPKLLLEGFIETQVAVQQHISLIAVFVRHRARERKTVLSSGLLWILYGPP